MPQYEIRDPDTGRKLKITLPAPPTPDQVKLLFGKQEPIKPGEKVELGPEKPKVTLPHDIYSDETLKALEQHQRKPGEFLPSRSTPKNQPPLVTPFSLLNTPSAATGAALGHLADQPGDLTGALGAAGREAVKAPFQPLMEQTSPAQELQKRAGPIGLGPAIFMDIMLDPLNVVGGEPVSDIMKAGIIGGPAAVGGIRRLFSRLTGEVLPKFTSKSAHPNKVISLIKNFGSPQEADAIGLTDWLKAKGDTAVTKAEVEDFIKSKELKLEERWLGATPSEADDALYEDLKVRQSRLREESSLLDEQEDALAGDLSEPEYQEAVSEIAVQREKIRAEWDENQVKISQLEDHDPRYMREDLILPGAENYRELLMKMPKPEREWFPVQAGGKYQLKNKQTGEVVKDAQGNPATWSSFDSADRAGITRDERNIFQSGHWDDPNVLLHMRTSDRMIPPPVAEEAMTKAEAREFVKKYGADYETKAPPEELARYRGWQTGAAGPSRSFFLEELQSDWHQLGREQGYRQPVTPDSIRAAHRNLEEHTAALMGPATKLEDAVNQLPEGMRPSFQGNDRYSREEALKNFANNMTKGYFDQTWFGSRMGLHDADPAVLKVYDDVMAASEAYLRPYSQWDLARRELNTVVGGGAGIPDAPFKGTDWTELGLKRALIEAAEKNYDSISWTTGRQQSERYGNLFKDVTGLRYDPDKKALYVRQSTRRDFLPQSQGGGWQRVGDEIAEKDLAGYVGKENAKKLLANRREPGFYVKYPDGKVEGPFQEQEGFKRYNEFDEANQVVDPDTGEVTNTANIWQERWPTFELDASDAPLEVGSRGMAQQYDEVMPNIANKIAKKFGVKAEQVDLPVGNPRWRVGTGYRDDPARAWAVGSDEMGEVLSYHPTREAAEEAAKKARANTEKVWRLKITPEMREEITKRGLPLAAAAPVGMQEGDLSTEQKLGVGGMLAAAVGGPAAMRGMGRLRSRLVTDVLPKLTGKSHPNRVLSAIKNFGSPEEADFIGLTKWLKSKGDTPVSAKEVAEFIEKNQIKLEETALGGEVKNKDVADAVARATVRRDEIYAMIDTEPEFNTRGIPYPHDTSMEPDPLLFQAAEILAGPPSYRQGHGQVILDALTPRQRELAEELVQVDALAHSNEDEAELLLGLGGGEAPGRPRYSSESLRLEGGKNYRELLIRMPQKEGAGTYRGPHWKEPNVLAHARITDRATADGKKALFLEEVQSDWHQKGREYGYQRDSGVSDARVQEILDKIESTIDRPPGYAKFTVRGVGSGWAPNDEFVGRYIRSGAITPEEGQELSRWWSAKSQIPDAPFKGTGWQDLTFKRALVEAAEGGHDEIAWTTGHQQSERYGKLLKDVREVARWGDDAFVVNGTRVNDEMLDEIQRLMPEADRERFAQWREEATNNPHRDPRQAHRFEISEPLTIGSKGMTQQYDQNLVNIAKKLGKKYGVEPRKIKVETKYDERRWKVVPSEEVGERAGEWAVHDPDTGEYLHGYRTRDEAAAALRESKRNDRIANQYAKKEDVWGMEITPEMRDDILKKGMPLAAAAPIGLDPESDLSAGEKAGLGAAMLGAAVGGPALTRGLGRLRSRLMTEVLPKVTGKSHPNRILSAIKNFGSPEEADAIGLTKWLKEKGNTPVTADEVKQFAEQNPLNLKEKWLTSNQHGPSPQVQEAFAYAEEADRGLAAVTSRAKSLANSPADMEMVETWIEGVATGTADITDVPEYLRPAITDASASYEDWQGRYMYANQLLDEWGDFGQPRYARGDLVLPGGQNYRELLIQKPIDRSQLPPGYSLKDFGEGHVASPPDPMGAKWHEKRWGVVNQSGYQVGYAQATPEEAIANAFETAPEMRAQAGGFQSTHWKEPDVLAHVRMTDRTMPDGAKALFLEETQSDWHQAGRERGYASEAQPEEYYVEFEGETNAGYQKIRVSETTSKELAEKILAEKNAGNPNGPYKLVPFRRDPGIPDAPFKGTGWQELTMKRALIDAAENGYDELAWTTGRQQSARYNKLLEDVNSASYNPETQTLYVSTQNGRVKEFNRVPEKDLQNILGADGARRLREGKDTPQTSERLGYALSGTPNLWHASFKDAPLEIGSKGMNQQYDQNMVAIANKLAKKYGATVEKTSMNTGQPMLKNLRLKEMPAAGGHSVWGIVGDKANSGEEYLVGYRVHKEEAEGLLRNAIDDEEKAKKPEPVWRLKITPEMRKDILEKGLPMAGGAPVGAAMAPEGEDEKSDRALMAFAALLGGASAAGLYKNRARIPKPKSSGILEAANLETATKGVTAPPKDWVPPVDEAGRPVYDAPAKTEMPDVEGVLGSQYDEATGQRQYQVPDNPVAQQLEQERLAIEAGAPEPGKVYNWKDGQMPEYVGREAGDKISREVKEIPIGTLIPTEVEDTKDVEAMARAIEEGVELPPILVQQAHDGRWYIVDGHTRWLAAKSLGDTHVPVRVLTQAADVAQ